MHPGTRNRRRSPFERTVHRTETVRRAGLPCGRPVLAEYARYFCFLAKTLVRDRQFLRLGLGIVGRAFRAGCWVRGLPVSLFRADVPPKVTHKGDRASTTGQVIIRKYGQCVRGTSFSSLYALTVLNRVRASRSTAIFNDDVQRNGNHSVSTLRAIRTFIRNTHRNNNVACQVRGT